MESRGLFYQKLKIQKQLPKAPLSSRDVKLRYEECLQNWGNAREMNVGELQSKRRPRPWEY